MPVACHLAAIPAEAFSDQIIHFVQLGPSVFAQPFEASLSLYWFLLILRFPAMRSGDPEGDKLLEHTSQIFCSLS